MNTEIKHTEGPWEIKPVSCPERAHPEVYSGQKRIAIPCNSEDVPAPESYYNAIIIAASPDLLKASYMALEALISLPQTQLGENAITELMAAIEKATK